MYKMRHRSRLLGWIITRAFYSSRLWERDLIAWLSGDCFSFRWIALPADTISSSRNRLFIATERLSYACYIFELF